MLGKEWRQRNEGKKKAVLVDALDTAFAEPKKSAENAEKLRAWLPPGMGFVEATKPAKEKKAKK